MAFEIFDDVAFYWFAITILSFVVIPRSVYLLIHPLLMKWKWFASWEKKDAGIEGADEEEICQCAMPECKQKREELARAKRKSFYWSLLSLKNVIFVLAWIGFIFMLCRASQYQSSGLASFNPYSVLEINDGAELPAIRKAYRTLSLKYHPGVCFVCVCVRSCVHLCAEAVFVCV